MIDGFISYRYGGGHTGSDISAVEWRIVRKRTSGFWNWLACKIMPTICVARIGRNYEYFCDGYADVMPMLRQEAEELRKLP